MAFLFAFFGGVEKDVPEQCEGNGQNNKKYENERKALDSAEQMF